MVPYAQVGGALIVDNRPTTTAARQRHGADRRPSGRHHVVVSTRTIAWQAGHFARLNTNSNVTPAGVRGFVIFNSSSVIDVTIRR